MLLLVHVSSALISIVYSTVIMIYPSRRRLFGAYVLIVSTLGSGTTLAWNNHVPFVHTCLSGLVYLGIVVYCVATARNKLSYASKKIT